MQSEFSHACRQPMINRSYISSKSFGFILEPVKELIVSIPVQQQFHLTSLHLFGDYCDDIQLVQLLITFRTFLQRLHIDFNCLLHLINDISNNAHLKASMPAYKSCLSRY